MKNLRAILVGLIAFSLAALPVGAAEMGASMTGGVSSASIHAECCPKADPCETQTKNDCGQSGTCTVKCSVVPATTVAGMDLSLPALTSEKEAPVVENLRSAPDYPPHPPPRV